MATIGRESVKKRREKEEKNEKNRRIYLHNCDTSAKLIDEYEWCRSAGRCLAFVTFLEWQSNWIDRWKDKHFFLFSCRRSLKHLLPLIIKKCSIERLLLLNSSFWRNEPSLNFDWWCFLAVVAVLFFLFNTNLLNSTSNRCSNKKFIHINDRYENIDRHSSLSKTIKNRVDIESKVKKKRKKKWSKSQTSNTFKTVDWFSTFLFVNVEDEHSLSLSLWPRRTNSMRKATNFIEKSFFFLRFSFEQHHD